EHRAPPVGEVRRRNEAGGVGPVLEEEAPLVDGPGEGAPVVGAEAAPDREVVRAVDDVDRVELDAAGVGGKGDEAAGGEGGGGAGGGGGGVGRGGGRAGGGKGGGLAGDTGRESIASVRVRM